MLRNLPRRWSRGSATPPVSQARRLPAKPAASIRKGNGCLQSVGGPGSRGLRASEDAVLTHILRRKDAGNGCGS
ncbi:hypothetical protein NDU88_001883 [Pleurodeles waltl]|uniref:Uncharacterized protein n=1 Tax=Pleurodeles waltl TaxID=8319 RepID=A0AAV7KRE5_PLEWA|nr:hypothetical protein NDU88_001883 [Pleurodeles waltl]